VSVKKNLVKATTTTAGAGTLTLSPMTGWAPFSVYTNGPVVPYAIENGDNKEVGLGTVGASNTLARTTVLATLVAGVYDDTSPVAITLSGNSTVISGPVAELFAASEISGLGALATKSTVATADIDAAAVTYAKIQNVSATDKLLGRSSAGAGSVEEIALTAAGRALIDDADAAAQRTTLGLGTAAVAATGTSGHVVPYLDTFNTFTANQVLNSTDAGSIGRILYLVHQSPSPAVDDAIGVLGFNAYNSAAAEVTFGSMRLLITDPTSGSEDARFAFATTIAGASNFRFLIGAGLYANGATGGDKGVDTINAAAVYDDNTLLTCYAIEAYKTGTVTTTFWDSTALDLDVAAQPERVENRPVTQKVMRAQRVRDGARLVETMVEVDEPVYDLLPVVDAAGKPVKDAAGKPVVERVQRMEQVVTAPAQPAGVETRTHAPAARFAARAAELLDPKLYGDSWKATGHLPAMPSPAEWEAAGKKMGLGDIQQRLWETVEVQAIHIDKLLARIEGLETRLTAAGL
jgi:hypothetical protein